MTTEAKIVCTCGHDQTLHAMVMQDNLCLQTGCLCWNFREVVNHNNNKSPRSDDQV